MPAIRGELLGTRQQHQRSRPIGPRLFKPDLSLNTTHIPLQERQRLHLARRAVAGSKALRKDRALSGNDRRGAMRIELSRWRRITRSTTLLTALLLAGCTTFSRDGGFATVEETARERLGRDVRWVRTDEQAASVEQTVKEVLAEALDADRAVQVALINNRGLQATYAELGIAEADLVQAGRIGNPRYSILRTKRGNDVMKVEEAIALDVIGILTIPLRVRLERRRFEAVQLEVSREMLAVAQETRKAWVRAVAAEETVRYLEQVRESAEASAELARRMAEAGNFPKLTHMREHAFYAESVAQLARARQTATAERETLTRLLGLSGESRRFRLPERLPDPPKELAELGDIESRALTERLDVQSARRETMAVAHSLGLTRVTRFVNALEIGRARTKEEDDPFAYGWEFSLEIPIFDWGGARVARAEAIYMRAVNRLAETAVNAHSEVREAYDAYRTRYETARHYREEIVPLRRRISEEVLLRYNGMLASVFELLADAREQVASVMTAIDATRDFWLAQSDMQAALNGAGGMRSVAAATTPTTASAASAGGH